MAGWGIEEKGNEGRMYAHNAECVQRVREQSGTAKYKPDKNYVQSRD